MWMVFNWFFKFCWEISDPDIYVDASLKTTTYYRTRSEVLWSSIVDDMEVFGLGFNVFSHNLNLFKCFHSSILFQYRVAGVG